MKLHILNINMKLGVSLCSLNQLVKRPQKRGLCILCQGFKLEIVIPCSTTFRGYQQKRYGHRENGF